MSATDAFERLYEIIVRLRAPDGCPWDREQTPSTMRGHLLEEAYESIEAIESDRPEDIREELGDLYLLVTMIARMYEEDGRFRVEDALESICEKLVRRHPHVFGEAQVSSADDVLHQWQRIKVEQEGKRAKTGALDGVSRALPSLERAFALQRKAAKVGFDWPSLSGVRDKLHEEIDEVVEAAGGESALAAGRRDADTADAALEREIGDMLFSAVNLARYLGVDPSTALNRANTKFTERFHHIERELARTGKQPSQEHFELMDELWDASKQIEPSE
ncbi:MAG: nucleoside triphosphate pyrophosphohydrolase [Spirochaetota bacterium]